MLASSGKLLKKSPEFELNKWIDTEIGKKGRNRF